MTNLLSTISGSFSKALIFGVFLPAVIFVLGFTLLIVPFMPSNLQLVEQLKELDPQWKILAMTFVVIIVSGLLYTLNIPLIRIYEGYPWKDTFFGNWRKRHYQNRFELLQSKRSGLRTLRAAMNEVKKRLDKAEKIRLEAETNSQKEEKLKEAAALEKPAVETQNAIIDEVKKKLEPLEKNIFYKDTIRELKINEESDSKKLWSIWNNVLRIKLSEIGRVLRTEYPADSWLILPTKLGNVIRSFEEYPRVEYKMDAIVLWSRLQAKIDKDYAVLVDDLKTNFDFLLNCSFLSFLLALILFITGISVQIPFINLRSLFLWLGEILGLALLSLWFYRLSIIQADAWGAKVKSAFDLYRNSLLTQLGFPAPPTTKKAEKDLWHSISVQMLYGDSPKGARFDYDQLKASPLPSIARTESKDVNLTVSRGFEILPEKNSCQVIITVRIKTKSTGNQQADKITAREVWINDILPDGWVYKWNSAKLEDQLIKTDSQTDVPGQAVTISPEIPEIRIEESNNYSFLTGDLEAAYQRKLIYEIFQLDKIEDKKTYAGSVTIKIDNKPIE